MLGIAGKEFDDRTEISGERGGLLQGGLCATASIDEYQQSGGGIHGSVDGLLGAARAERRLGQGLQTTRLDRTTATRAIKVFATIEARQCEIDALKHRPRRKPDAAQDIFVLALGDLFGEIRRQWCTLVPEVGIRELGAPRKFGALGE
jgi:hypothetical protein